MTNIEEKIRSLAPLPVDDFMAMAVRHYYATHNSIGKVGDFITSPEISQMFGEILGAWCIQQLHTSGPFDFNLVELGAGNGTMMHDVLRIAMQAPEFVEHLGKIIIVENSQKLRAKQASSLSKYADKIAWVEHYSQIPNGNIILLANEFLDALPIKQFKKVNGIFHEVVVIAADGKLEYGLGPASNIDAPTCHERGILEICPSIQELITILRHKAHQISCLFIDYGYLEPPFRSTLQAVSKHKYSDALQNPGTADITALVNFSALGNICASLKMDVNICTQGEFLDAYGIQIRANRLKELGAPKEEIDAAVYRLTHSSQMGSLFKVLQASTLNL